MKSGRGNKERCTAIAESLGKYHHNTSSAPIIRLSVLMLLDVPELFTQRLLSSFKVLLFSCKIIHIHHISLAHFHNPALFCCSQEPNNAVEGKPLCVLSAIFDLKSPASRLANKGLSVR